MTPESLARAWQTDDVRISLEWVKRTDAALIAFSPATSHTPAIMACVERRIADRLAFRGDLRYFFGSNLVPDYWRLGAGLTIDLGTR